MTHRYSPSAEHLFTKWLELSSSSIAFRLMLGGLDPSKLLIGPRFGNDYPVSYLAESRGTRNILDNLFLHFDIEEQGSRHFKNLLKEKWLLESDFDDRRNEYNRVWGAISELAVARLIEDSGGQILTLAAIAAGKANPDFTYLSSCGKSEWKCISEVKFVGLPRLQHKLGVEASCNSAGIAAGWVEPPQIQKVFILFKIAEAAVQLEGYQKDLRHVHLVFSSSASAKMLLSEEIGNSWYLDDVHLQAPKLAQRIESTISTARPPIHYFREASHVSMYVLDSSFRLRHIKTVSEAGIRWGK